ncbi:MAG: hypothetical protein VW518_10860 [Burkholderiaceae bacterium]
MIDRELIDEYIDTWNDHRLREFTEAVLNECGEMRQHITYAASLIQCRIEGDDIPISDIRDYLLHAVGMTIQEAMIASGFWEDEEE